MNRWKNKQLCIPSQVKFARHLTTHSGESKGAQKATPPPKIGLTMGFFIQLFIRMLKNKAQIARESIKITL